MKTLKDKAEDLTGGDMQEIENRDSAIHTKDVAEAKKEFEEKSLRQKSNNKISAYWSGYNDAIVQLLAIHDKVFGDFSDALVENHEEENNDDK